jgi:hypothetical protein
MLALALGLTGCPKTGYIGGVDAYVPRQHVALARAAWLGLGGFEGPLSIQGGNPDCLYYGKRLTRSNVEVGITDCYHPSKASEYGWLYTVTVSQFSVGNRSEVRAEIDELLEAIRKAIQAQVPGAKVTKGAGAVGMPF